MDIENAKKHLSDLQKERRKKKISLPRVLKGKVVIREQPRENALRGEHPWEDVLEKHFPHLFKKPVIHLCAEDAVAEALHNGVDKKKSFDETDSTKLADDTCAGGNCCTEHSTLQELLDMSTQDGDTINMGVLFTGLPAPGGHNIVCGMLDSLKKKNKKNTLYGFINGFEGVKNYSFMELKNEYISMFRNSGGLDMLKSSSFHFLSESGKRKCFKICRQLNLTGLIIVGGVDSQKQITELAEYFEHVHFLARAAERESEEQGDDPTYQIVSDLSDAEIKAKYPRRGKKRSRKKTCIVCAPKSVHNEIDSDLVECALGFDTTVFTYCQYISYLTSHVRTYQTGYHFVRVIGNSSSHVALECFLQTKANVVLISEEIKKKKKKLKDVIDFMVHMVQKRYDLFSKRYGIVIVPEGLLGKIGEFKKMVRSLLWAKKRALHSVPNVDDAGARILAQFYADCATSAGGAHDATSPDGATSTDSAELFRSLPDFFQKTLLEEIQSDTFKYSRLKTEELLLACVKEKIEQTHMRDLHFVSHAYTNEVTCSLPSNFDSSYSYLLGMGCVEIAHNNCNGYLCSIRKIKNLLLNVEKVQLVGVPLCSLLRVKEGKTWSLVPEEGHNHISSAAHKSEHVGHDEKLVFVKRDKVNLDSAYFLTYKKHRSALLYGDMYRTHGGIQFERSVADDGEENSVDSLIKLNKVFSNTFSTWDSKWGELFNRVNFTVSGLSGGYLVESSDANGNANHPSRGCPSDIEKALSSTPVKFNTNLMRQNSEIAHVESHFESKLNYTPFEHIHRIRDLYVVRTPQGNVKGSVKGRSRCGDNISVQEKKNVGVAILSHPVPGVNNVLVGLHERLSMSNITLIGFVKGIKGLLTNETYILKDNHMSACKNLGGASLLGVQLKWKKDNGEVIRVNNLVQEKYIKQIISNCEQKKIRHLVFIGDEKVITVMNILNEYFIKDKHDLIIITVPVSLYNSFYTHLIECSMGYHSIIYTISDMIGNLQSSAVNTSNYYYFVKVPTNLSSLSLLSVQLETHCNICLVGECIEYQMLSLEEVVGHICNIIVERINRKKYYGTILFSSNLLLNISDFSRLIADVEENVQDGDELDRLIKEADVPDGPLSRLTKESAELLRICTRSMKEKLLRKENRYDDEVDSNFENFLIDRIKKHITQLMEQAKQSNEPYSFHEHMKYVHTNVMARNVKLYNDLNYLQHFNCVIKNIDREINCCIPTHFDNSLAFSHGLLAGIAIENDLVNYVTSIRHLHLNKRNWSSSLYPGFYFVNRDDAGGVAGYPYAAPVPVSVKSSQMATIKHNAETWAYNDCYIFVGPYQHEVNTDSPGCSSHIF
ncbi:diphosphate-fructose-6-phosphate 1-phosphotransferase [Plasmodium fragile]|uniref:Diphosphate-fructose-6-phosphate 1-phosphotransferase n=1 Tax=Plasmodium fragile TaxID=5857 RepID=A0A0D9QT07_PLAFR|nr:diphosphate-fructose-6-phosphate 1-phosphotransferase [Plasmodium fragile]KJP90179.1 diphosphate-fructose-6-phosphate 1-phosphotransferase [Plasmodium fragile]